MQCEDIPVPFPATSWGGRATGLLPRGVQAGRQVDLDRRASPVDRYAQMCNLLGVLRPRTNNMSRSEPRHAQQHKRQAIVPINGAVSHACRPFLRWVGGKQRSVPRLRSYLPPDFAGRRYVEPFVGAGSLFFSVSPTNALLADANPALIRCYEHIRANVGQVARHLLELRRHDSEDFYYETRTLFNSSSWSCAQAARFIYLNRTCYNGIFRVNTEGHFNVPYGYKDAPRFPSRAELTAASDALSSSILAIGDYATTLARARGNSFVYLDPPYPPLNGTAFFTHYTLERFSEDQQEQLACCVDRAVGRGAEFLMTNADTALIRSLYKQYSITSMPVTRWVTCKRKKHAVSELLITSYRPTP